MKYILTTLVALGLSSGAVFADSKAALDVIVGKTLFNDKVSDMKLRKNGKFSLVFNGKKMSGKWSYKKGQFCRKLPAMKLDGCQDLTLVKDGDRTGVEFKNPGADKGNIYWVK